MFVYYNYTQGQFQGLDYVFVREAGLSLIMLPHGNKEGQLFDRGGNEVNEAFILEIAEIIRNSFAINEAFEASQCSIVAAPCYPKSASQIVEKLEILGNWDTPTYATEDLIGFQFVIKSWELTVR
jgi:hypothetical protein